MDVQVWILVGGIGYTKKMLLPVAKALARFHAGDLVHCVVMNLGEELVSIIRVFALTFERIRVVAMSASCSELLSNAAMLPPNVHLTLFDPVNLMPSIARADLNVSCVKHHRSYEQLLNGTAGDTNMLAAILTKQIWVCGIMALTSRSRWVRKWICCCLDWLEGGVCPIGVNDRLLQYDTDALAYLVSQSVLQYSPFPQRLATEGIMKVICSNDARYASYVELLCDHLSGKARWTSAPHLDHHAFYKYPELLGNV